jgi:hypothetical protein
MVTVSRIGVTVPLREIKEIPRPDRDAGDKHRPPIGSTKSTPAALAAIEPSSGAPNCVAEGVQDQDTETSCLVVDIEGSGYGRPLANAPLHATAHDQSTRTSGKSDPAIAAVDDQYQPSVSRLPSDPGIYDEVYALQQVEARQYADRDVPVLIVQGIVSNMSNGQRSVPPLLAIVQDARGNEILRWKFRAEVDGLGPGGSTGFRSEMFLPGSESAKVTVVFSAEQQTMQ